MPRVLELLELLAELLALAGVEARGGLVEQQHLRLPGERPGDRDELALAERQVGRVGVGELVEADRPRAPRRRSALAAASARGRNRSVTGAHHGAGSAAASRFSRTVRSSNSSRLWNVRPSPARMRW